MKLWRIVVGVLNRFYNKFSIKRMNVNIVEPITIYGRIKIDNKGVISIGPNFIGRSGVKHNPIGGDTVLRLITRGSGEISIGRNVGISNSTLYCEKKITIGDNVMIGGGCKIWDTDFHSLDEEIRTGGNDHSYKKSKIEIKDGAFIGGSVTVLKGVVIGNGSVVGAGSVVTKNIPNYEVWAGNPAKFIKKISLQK